MEIRFKKPQYRFIKSLVDISDDLDKIINQSEISKGDLQTAEGNKNIHFEKKGDKIEIDFEGEHFQIDKEPICFLSKDNKLLFKIYDKSNLSNLNNIEKRLKNIYDLFTEKGEKIEFQNIIENKLKSVIIKKKNDLYENIFKPLCERIKTEEKHIEINSNLLLPNNSQSLLINHSSKFKIIIDKRKVLKEKIISFMENNKKWILKIYGSNGIGKSVTFLYFMAIETNYKIIYFNLKDIFIYQHNPHEYFKNALMKYYSSNNYDNEKIISHQRTNDEIDKCNYDVYLRNVQNLETMDLFKKGDFWDMLDCFCDFIVDDGNQLIIIDQYKVEYDNENKSINLKNIITKYGKSKLIKFLIASSLNDNTVKEDLISDLLYIYKEQIEFLGSFENSAQMEIIDIEDAIFKDFYFDQENKEDENKDFKNISLFNFDKVDDLTKIKSNEITEQKKDAIIKNENEKKIMNKYMNIDSNLIELTEIIYINNLVSVEEIIKTEDYQFYKLFNFSPEVYTKFNFLFGDNSNLHKDKFYNSFMDSKFAEIDNKIEKFYQNLKNNKYINYSPNYLKYTFLEKLREIIENKKELNLNELIKYLEVFPFKYLKINLSKDNSTIKDNIIDIDERIKDSKFILDYSFDYIDIAFAKILNQIPSSTLIDMKDLSGSGKGSFIENKIKNFLENNGFITRYLWDFITPAHLVNKDKNKTDKYIYDYNNYKKIKLEYDEFKENIILDYKKLYYIIPGKQINKLLDSVILLPYNYDSFNMISLQITKNKIDFPKKEDYVKKCFEAKKKFETIYKIKINKMYFYFIMAKDFPNNKTKEELELKNIDYFYFSIKEQKFTKNGYIINLENLGNIEAEISQNNGEDEYRYFESKCRVINFVEKYLQKKRRLDKDIKISEKLYEAAIKHLSKNTCTVHLDPDIKKNMKDIVIKHSKIYKKNLFTFQFVFYIYLKESSFLDDKDYYIGILIHPTKKGKSEDKLYQYFYNGEIFPDNIDLPAVYFDVNKKKRNKFLPLLGDYYISKIDKKYWNRIYVFKIYDLNNN